jgi:hypothetical protein
MNYKPNQKLFFFFFSLYQLPLVGTPWIFHGFLASGSWKFKQRWSTIPPTSTKLTTTSQKTHHTWQLKSM